MSDKHDSFRLIEFGEMSGLRRDGTAKTPPRVTKLSGAIEDRTGTCFLCSADHEQKCQSYPVDPHSTESSADHTCIHQIQSECGE